jgi:hypothetical protein
MKKDFEFGDKETGIVNLTVRQANGMERMKWEAAQARALRHFREFGMDLQEWTEDQQNEFVTYLDDNGVGIEMQLKEWVPQCIIEPADFDIGVLTSNELRELLLFVRGDTSDGAVPLV